MPGGDGAFSTRRPVFVCPRVRVPRRPPQAVCNTDGRTNERSPRLSILKTGAGPALNVQGPMRVVGERVCLLKDVERGAADAAARQHRDESSLVDDVAAAERNENGRLLHRLEGGRAYPSRRRPSPQRSPTQPSLHAPTVDCACVRRSTTAEAAARV